MRRGEIRIVEQVAEDEGEARIVHFNEFDLEPFGYEELLANTPGRPLTAKMKIRRAVLGEGCRNIEVTTDRYASDVVLESRLRCHSYALVEGGWFAPGLTAQDNLTYLLDRCAYDGLRRLCRDPEADLPHVDFLQYLARPGTRFSVLPILLEGNQRRPPNDFEIYQQFHEVTGRLRTLLPGAELRPEGAAAIRVAADHLRDQFLSLTAETAFLADIATDLASPVSQVRRKSIIEKIRLSADLHGVAKSSFAFLAAISAVLCHQSRNPARKILKVKTSWRDEDIHNALCDLRMLKILSVLIATAPDETPAFCTADKNLALFWVGLGAHSFRPYRGRMTFDIPFSADVLPGVDRSVFE